MFIKTLFSLFILLHSMTAFAGLQPKIVKEPLVSPPQEVVVNGTPKDECND